MKELGQYENTVIVLVSDHGEGLGEHGELSHGYYIYNSTIHVPLIIKAPGVKQQRIQFPVRTLDILPTVMPLLGRGESGKSNGENLSVYFGDTSKPAPILSCYSEAYYAYHVFGWSALSSVVENNYKYIATKKGELYDIVADPGETKNLIGEAKYQKIAKGLHQQILHARKNTGVPQIQGLEDSNESLIMANGYLQGCQPKIAPYDGPDPAEMRDVIKLIGNAQTQMFLRRYSQCQQILQLIVKRDPNNIQCWMLFGKLYTQLGQFDKALAAFEKMEELTKVLRFCEKWSN